MGNIKLSSFYPIIAVLHHFGDNTKDPVTTVITMSTLYILMEECKLLETREIIEK